MTRMTMSLTLLAATLSLVPAAGAATGQRTVLTPAELDQALTRQVDSAAQKRAAIQALLERDDVRAMAENAGVDLRRARAAAATLDGPELDRVATLASGAQADLAGAGSNTIQISTVTLLLIIIIVILLAK